MRRIALVRCHRRSLLLVLVAFCACGEKVGQSGTGAPASGTTSTVRGGQSTGGRGGGTNARTTANLNSGGTSSSGKSIVGKGGTTVTKSDSYTRGGTQESSGGVTQSTAGGTAGNAGETSEVFRVIGYEPSWSGDIDQIQYDKLTAINYAFALVNTSGKLQAVENTAKLDALVQQAHQHGVEVFISVGGWNDGDDSAFHAFAGSSATREIFAEDVLAFVLDHQLDGADIDWEYPDAGQSARDYTALMTLLATRLHGAQKSSRQRLWPKAARGLRMPYLLKWITST